VHSVVALTLQLLLAGLQDIDVNDWKRHTKYRGEYSANHPVIVNFWKVRLSAYSGFSTALYLHAVTLQGGAYGSETLRVGRLSNRTVSETISFDRCSKRRSCWLLNGQCV